MHLPRLLFYSAIAIAFNSAFANTAEDNVRISAMPANDTSTARFCPVTLRQSLPRLPGSPDPEALAYAAIAIGQTVGVAMGSQAPDLNRCPP
jgi:hypothetical protein